ncbi:DUF1190 domain-containing protein [Caulobacter sp. 17J80-11]|uniref:DUF1190 domain-containing protein n=1 Tax=Caulobacter sp. 17J80-11 TaxID=2763502 RepID=UPI001653D157|nr:DUF1190 domain-containing protein [Caulobacter sp. 17J80-11]MBC6983009.1 DUF1190 domain-containing protein [Caulobacter sp. 17J80-11]
MTSKRRSASVGFSVLGLSAATVLAGCEQRVEAPAEETPVYASVEQCRQENMAEDCDTAFQQAKADHARTAPKFADKAACEADWGAGSCEEQPPVQAGGHSVFMPMMMGFLIGRAFGGGGYPVYGSPGGGLYSGGNKVGDAPVRNGKAMLPSRLSVASTPEGGVVSRGGFGATARGEHAGG